MYMSSVGYVLGLSLQILTPHLRKEQCVTPSHLKRERDRDRERERQRERLTMTVPPSS